jgi:hypothetical protein
MSSTSAIASLKEAFLVRPGFFPATLASIGCAKSAAAARGDDAAYLTIGEFCRYRLTRRQRIGAAHEPPIPVAGERKASLEQVPRVEQTRLSGEQFEPLPLRSDGRRPTPDEARGQPRQPHSTVRRSPEQAPRLETGGGEP